MCQGKGGGNKGHPYFQTDFPTAVGRAVNPIVVQRRGPERTTVGLGQKMYSEYMINVKVRSQYLYDVPIVQTDEVLYPGPFPPEVASRVNDYRAAAFPRRSGNSSWCDKG